MFGDSSAHIICLLANATPVIREFSTANCRWLTANDLQPPLPEGTDLDAVLDTLTGLGILRHVGDSYRLDCQALSEIHEDCLLSLLSESR
ncbi:hypothetical protein GCM10027562_00440 [Arthrobacter pigmenti]